jgi:hypothetical protein
MSFISWRSVLLVEETGEPRENHRPVASHWHIILYIVYLIKMLNVPDINVNIFIIAQENNRIKRRSYCFSKVQGHYL